MQNGNSASKEKNYTPLIVAVSILIPLVVAVLFFLPQAENISPELRSFLNHLPLTNAIINGTATVMLIAGVIAIKNKNMVAHKRFMSTAILLSILFLVSYISFHLTSETTRFGGEGIAKGIYYFILITHILLSIAIVPLVLITYVRALSQRFDKHKKIARITFPLWLYVTITGVLVYIMISPYYAFNA